jgi:RNA polymerase sigma factor (sigma-70 family)
MDRALFEAFRRGDRDALERVYRSHIDDVERFVGARLARARRFSAANLADVVQDIFLRAFSPSARTSYDGERAYAPFLMTIARNVLVDWLRRSSREVADTSSVEALVDASLPNPTEDTLFEPELVNATRSYIESLPVELRGVHEQRFVKAEPQRSAAEALGLSRQSLRTLERKLVEGLRRALRRGALHDDVVDFRQPNRPSNS